jgi:hypothetical protein
VGQHELYRFSATVRTPDLAVLHCLRSLSQFAQATGNKRIPWGGTKEDDWKRTGQSAVFHFSRASYRERFLEECRRLLPAQSWELVSTDDDDPARPQS